MKRLDRIRTLLFAIFALAILNSCSEEKDPVIGIWDDNIKLSSKYAEFNAEADSVIITTEGDWWWVNGITVGDSSYSFYNDENIDLESEQYSINQDFFVVERSDKNTLFIKMERNSSGKERTMTVSLEAGNYFDYVQIKQLGQ